MSWRKRQHKQKQRVTLVYWAVFLMRTPGRGDAQADISVNRVLCKWPYLNVKTSSLKWLGKALELRRGPPPLPPLHANTKLSSEQVNFSRSMARNAGAARKTRINQNQSNEQHISLIGLPHSSRHFSLPAARPLAPTHLFIFHIGSISPDRAGRAEA